MAKRLVKKKKKKKVATRSLFDGSSDNDEGEARPTSSGASAGGKGPGGSDPFGYSDGSGDGDIVPLHEAAQARYLNYALSVITSRALPDVRDGLKPVQRRIMFTMWQQRLTADAKFRKSAKVVGDVMGNYHPHGDSSIYEALVRQAQPWVMRAPLVEGSGNFGSIDGDPPAAMRYTECRLQRIADELLSEIGQQTVHFRPSYDGTKSEPVVLPSRIPNTLLSGSTGIAVGMATNIPPHNLGELCKACIKLLDDPELQDYQLVANDAVQGPDFPTGGQILNSKDELREIYKTGQGPIRIRATTKKGTVSRAGRILIIDSVPYSVNKSVLVEQIAQIILNRKMPHLVDVRDVSADDIRIELVLKKDADEKKALAYLYKNTSLQTNFNVNLTCLVPTENPDVCRPERLGIKQILWHFLHFRLEVVTKRLEFELAQLERRLHMLEGFAFAFDILDDIIKIIRKSSGKADAATQILKKYGVKPEGPRTENQGGLDAEQIEAILELKLYRLARLEINLIQDELKEKRKRAKEIKRLLAEEDAKGRWQIVRDEINEIIAKYVKSNPDAKRRSQIIGQVEETEYSAEDFIIAEDNMVIVTRDGWVKRQKDTRAPSKSRMREGDAILAAQPGSTRETIVFFSNFGTAYTSRIIDIPASTGYGEPIQKLFKLKDGERIVAAFSLDPRVLKDIKEDPKNENACPTTHAFAATSDGYALRFGLETFLEPSTRAGRKYARPKKGSTVIGVDIVNGFETIIAVSKKCRAILCPAEEVNYLSGAGLGVILMKLKPDDRLLGFKASKGDRDLMEVETNRGAKKTVSTVKYEVTGRGGAKVAKEHDGFACGARLGGEDGIAFAHS